MPPTRKENRRTKRSNYCTYTSAVVCVMTALVAMIEEVKWEHWVLLVGVMTMPDLLVNGKASQSFKSKVGNNGPSRKKRSASTQS